MGRAKRKPVDSPEVLSYIERRKLLVELVTPLGGVVKESEWLKRPDPYLYVHADWDGPPDGWERASAWCEIATLVRGHVTFSTYDHTDGCRFNLAFRGPPDAPRLDMGPLQSGRKCYGCAHPLTNAETEGPNCPHCGVERP